jgi:hypothetical protein
MSENAKTITFVVIGLVAIVLGIVTQPSSADLDETTLVNEYLTKDLSADEAKRLKIVRFDEDTATIRDFEVAEQDGLWSIPSKDGYPADAAAQMAAAANSLMDLKILQVAATSDADHEQYGVIDPTSPKLQPGQKGVGTRVTMSNDQNKPLVDLIVGKSVKGAEGQRYVRETGRSLVYVVEIDRSKLSTNFEDWIEKDLLKLNSWDLQQVDIKDYSASLVQVMSPDGRPDIGIDMDDRAELVFTYNDSDAKWAPVKLSAFDATKGERGEYVDFTLAEDDELNQETLNALKTALDDLQIVDVVRKPQGLSKDLKAGEDFVKNTEAKIELMMKGFTPTQKAADGPQEIISSDGEVVATMKNGTEYVLRFGNLTSADREKTEDAAGQPADPAATADAAAAAGEKNNSDVHRYMFVMARLNKDAVKKPQTQPLPELPKDEPAAAEAGAEAPAAEAAAPPAEAATSDGDAAESAETPAEAAEEEKKNGESASAAAAPEETKSKEVEKIIADRERIENENRRKLDEYNDLLKKGEENVKELNLRFGDWYFVVDDDVFQKIRLGRDDVIKKKEKPKAEGEAAETNPNVQPGATPTGLPAIPGATQ